MSIRSFVQSVLPNASEAFYDRMKAVTSVKHMITGDISHWRELRTQINPSTSKINSYRDIRKITAAEGRITPSLGTLRNYLGEGGTWRQEQARVELEEWFREFQNAEAMFREEHKDLLTPEDWGLFREKYRIFMGY